MRICLTRNALNCA